MTGPLADEIRVGQVWCDTDPRGGPTFRIIDLSETHAVVTDLNGNRRRRIQLARLPKKYRLQRQPMGSEYDGRAVPC